MKFEIRSDWNAWLKTQKEQPYFEGLNEFLTTEYTNGICYPPEEQIFEAFELCTFEQTKVIIIGQDPYHGLGEAHGLSFSVLDGIRTPPSLRNIFKELKNDLKLEVPTSGNLSSWATQGVLLLNATLTVRENTPGSHQKKGWETFTDNTIQMLSQEKEALVFLLWGAQAQKKEVFIDTKKHLVLKSKHPSPMSANSGGWFGEHHFSKTNVFLRNRNLKPIEWKLPNQTK